MAVPTTKVYIGFKLPAGGGTSFILNDTTKGKLDSIYVLGGDVLTDVTSYVASVSIDRGKSRELDRYTAGHASITLHNDSRIFDPFNTSSIYYGNIVPRKPIAIETNGVRVFTGFIDDWDLTYDISGKSYASISAVDGFMRLSAAEIKTFTTTSQLSSARVSAILDRAEVAWPNANRSIDTGLTTLQADTIPDNINALQYLQLIETTENGQLFMNKSGAVTFKNRAVNPSLISTTVFSDDSTANAIPYANIGVVYGSENLYNRVIVTRNAGTAQTADSTTSQNKYGVSAYSIDGVLLTSDSEALSLASYLVGLYDDPELRINEVTVNLHDKTSEQVASLTKLEIADVIQVIFTPNKIGSAINQYAMITGINHNVGIAEHQVTFDLTSTTVLNFVLDNTKFGILDTNILAY